MTEAEPQQSDRVFLDANVLFSAAYRGDSGLHMLWRLADVILISSAYAVEEARRNLQVQRASALPRLAPLVSKLMIVDPRAGMERVLPVKIDAKDQPILRAAIHAQAEYLLTGDLRHFGHIYGKRVAGVLVLRPSQYLQRRVT
jgi:predicted nucleic acid-binding protein